MSIRGVGEQKGDLKDGKDLIQQRPYKYQEFQVSGRYASLGKGAPYEIVYDVLAYASWVEAGSQPGGRPQYAASAEDRKWMLESTPSVPHDSPAFAAFARRNGWDRQEGEDPLAFLGRVCADVLRGPYRFAETGGGPGGQHLLRVIQRTACDCAGYATLLAAVCHRSGIRFDVLPGRRIADGGLMSIHHVLGIADLDGYGLFPVDLSEVVKGRSMQHFQSYGSDWQLMACCRGEDVKIPAVLGGEHYIQFVQGPHLAVAGSGGDPRRIVSEDSWSVRDA